MPEPLASPCGCASVAERISSSADDSDPQATTTTSAVTMPTASPAGPSRRTFAPVTVRPAASVVGVST